MKLCSCGELLAYLEARLDAKEKERRASDLFQAGHLRDLLDTEISELKTIIEKVQEMTRPQQTRRSA